MWLQTSHNGSNLWNNRNQGMEILRSPKIDELKPMSHKQFNDLIKDSRFRVRNDYVLKDLKVKFSFKPLVEREEH